MVFLNAPGQELKHAVPSLAQQHIPHTYIEQHPFNPLPLKANFSRIIICEISVIISVDARGNKLRKKNPEGMLLVRNRIIGNPKTKLPYQRQIIWVHPYRVGLSLLALALRYASGQELKHVVPSLAQPLIPQTYIEQHPFNLLPLTKNFFIIFTSKNLRKSA